MVLYEKDTVTADLKVTEEVYLRGKNMPHTMYSIDFRGYTDWWYKDNVDEKRRMFKTKFQILVTQCRYKETKYVLESSTGVVKKHLK